METRNLTCIGCPLGCSLVVEKEKDTVVLVKNAADTGVDIVATKNVEKV